eukprot:EG_transcript_21736
MSSTPADVRAACLKAARPDANHGLPPAEILPWLHIGTKDDALKLPLLDDLNVKTVINAGLNKSNPGPDFYPGKTYVPVEIEDETGDVLAVLPKVIDAIDGAKAAGEPAYVHCAASVSRGPVFAIAYVMKEKGLNAADATRYVAERWGATFPCDGFIDQLITYEKQLQK